ncbi:hypothetical protein CBL_05985 [Carabus blaptoides fortunei]
MGLGRLASKHRTLTVRSDCLLRILALSSPGAPEYRIPTPRSMPAGAQITPRRGQNRVRNPVISCVHTAKPRPRTSLTATTASAPKVEGTAASDSASSSSVAELALIIVALKSELAMSMRKGIKGLASLSNGIRPDNKDCKTPGDSEAPEQGP